MEKLTDEFVQLNPNDTLNKRLHYNVATVLLNNNEFAKAEQGFKKALCKHLQIFARSSSIWMAFYGMVTMQYLD